MEISGDFRFASTTWWKGNAGKCGVSTRSRGTMGLVSLQTGPLVSHLAPSSCAYTLLFIHEPDMSTADPLIALPDGTFPLDFAPDAREALRGKKRTSDDEVVALRCELRWGC